MWFRQMDFKKPGKGLYILYNFLVWQFFLSSRINSGLRELLAVRVSTDLTWQETWTAAWQWGREQLWPPKGEQGKAQLLLLALPQLQLSLHKVWVIY